MPYKWAAARQGIHDQTIRNWAKRGEDKEEPYVGFFEALTRANAECMRACVMAVKLSDSANTTHKGSEFLLDRRFRGDFGRVTGHELTGANGGAIKTEAGLDGKSTAELAALLARVESMESPDKD